MQPPWTARLPAPRPPCWRVDGVAGDRPPADCPRQGTPTPRTIPGAAGPQKIFVTRRGAVATNGKAAGSGGPGDGMRLEGDAGDISGPTDEQLAAQAAREGSDGAAFAALMDRFRERVWRVCWRLMGSEHDAEDAAQEVFVRLFFERGKFAGRSRYSTWLHAVAIRTCLMLRRSRSRRRRREEPGGDGRIETTADAKPSGSDAVDATHDIGRLLDGLDEEDRALVLMRFAESHDYEELAEMFGTTAGACRMRISRIREKLAAKAGRMFGDGPRSRVAEETGGR